MGKCYKVVKAKEGGTLLLAHTLGAMVGAVMRAVNPHKSDIRSIRPVVECGWVRMLWLIFLAHRGCLFRLRLFQFTHRLPQKSNSPKIQKIPIQSGTPHHNSSVLGYAHTISDSFAPAGKPYRKGLLFTHNNGDFGAISVTVRSCVRHL